jgi:hypothetical protein
MATSKELRGEIQEFARQLREKIGNLEVPEDACWMSAVEDLAVEIGDSLTTAVMEDQAQALKPHHTDQCPDCGKQGRYCGDRQRSLLTRRGPATIPEPEYYCPCCRKAFFPDDQRNRG